MINYNELVKKEEKNTIAIDFDGVIHNDSLGFHDGTIYGEIMPGASESIKSISEMGFTIIIFTAKAKTDRPLVNGMTGAQLVWQWLEKHNLANFIHDVTSEKPRALLYVDDKAYRHYDWSETLNYITNIDNV